MKNRKLLLIVSLVLALTMSLGGTLAYLTDTDSDVNVMTLGNVDIEQWENGKVDGFEQNQPLYPAYYEGDDINWDDAVGVVDKYVQVKNIGNSQAYVRTWIAFEADAAGKLEHIFIDWDTTNAELYDKGNTYTIAAEINGEILTQDYVIYSVTYAEPVAPNAIVSSLKKIAMAKEADNAYVTSFGGTYDVLVLSQAVQTTNLESLGAEGALNEAFTSNHPWDAAAEEEVPDTTTLKAAIEAVEDKNYATLTLSDDATWETGAEHGSTPMVAEDAALKALTIDGNGKTLTATGAGVGPLRAANGGTITFKNMTIVDNSQSYAEDSWEFGYLEFAGNLVFENVTFENAIMISGENAKFVNCSFNSNKDNEYAVWVDNGSATFENCTFTGPRGLKVHEDYGTNVDSVVVDNCTFVDITKKPGIAIGTVDATTEVTVKDSKFIACQPGDQNKYIYETDTAVTSFKFTEENNLVTKALTEIATAEELRAFAQNVNNGKDFAGEYVVLTSDIDLANRVWTPIGQTGATEFKGVFDGQGHTIKNLSVDSSAQTGANYSSGLFGWIESHDQGITIKNVTVDGATITGHHNVAVIAGYLEGDSVIENCHVKNATLTCTHANNDACGDKAGAIAGYVAGEVTIKSCSAENSSIFAGRDAGQLLGASYATPVDCSAKNVTVTVTGDCTGANISNTLVGRDLSN